MRVGLELQHFGLQKNHFQQCIQTDLLFGRDLNHDRVTAPGLGNESMFRQSVLHTIRIGAGLVDLVDGHNNRNGRGFGMINRFDRLRHHSIVCCHDQDDNIGDLSATTSHGGEGFMARRVQERHLFPAYRNRVGADMLRNPAGLAFRHLRLPDGIKQRGLAVIDMAHDRHDRWPSAQAGHLSVCTTESSNSSPTFSDRHIDLDPVLLRNDHGCINVHGLIECEHLAHIHQLAHDVGRALSDQLRKLLHRHAGHKLEALPPWLSHFPRRAVMHVLAAVVTALLHRNGTKILPASRILMKPKLFFFPRTAWLTSFLRLLFQTLGLHLFKGKGFLFSCDHIDAWHYGELDGSRGNRSGHRSYENLAGRALSSDQHAQRLRSQLGDAPAGDGLTGRVSMNAPLVPADSTVGRNAASSAGMSSALFRLIRMRRLSDLEDSSAAGAAWDVPVLRSRYVVGRHTDLTSLTPARIGIGFCRPTRRFLVSLELRAELLQDLLHHVVIQRATVRRDGDPHPFQFRNKITVFHPELLSQCIHTHENLTPTPLDLVYPASDSDSARAFNSCSRASSC